jgi:hypothetical protein
MLLTKREALEVTRNLWIWISNNNRHEGVNTATFKRSYPGWEDKKYKNNCPLCEYKAQNKISCTKCLIEWPEYNCFSKESPYKMWRDSISLETQREYALEIIALCTDALLNLHN